MEEGKRGILYNEEGDYVTSKSVRVESMLLAKIRYANMEVTQSDSSSWLPASFP